MLIIILIYNFYTIIYFRLESIRSKIAEMVVEVARNNHNRRVSSRRRNKRECLRVSLRTCHASGFANSCPVSHLSTSGGKGGRRWYVYTRIYIEENRRLEEGSLFFSRLVLPGVEVFRETFVTENRRKMYASVVLAATSRLASSLSHFPPEARGSASPWTLPPPPPPSPTRLFHR